MLGEFGLEDVIHQVYLDLCPVFSNLGLEPTSFIERVSWILGERADMFRKPRSMNDKLVRLEDMLGRWIRPSLEHNRMGGKVCKPIERLILVVEQNLGLLGRSRIRSRRTSTSTVCIMITRLTGKIRWVGYAVRSRRCSHRVCALSRHDWRLGLVMDDLKVLCIDYNGRRQWNLLCSSLQSRRFMRGHCGQS